MCQKKNRVLFYAVITYMVSINKLTRSAGGETFLILVLYT